MTTLDLAVVGNSNVAALIDRGGRIVWTSWPRIDGDPVFCALLDGEDPDSGFFSIDFDEEITATEQNYDRIPRSCEPCAGQPRGHRSS